MEESGRVQEGEPALWAGMASVTHSFQLLASVPPRPPSPPPPTTHTACPGVREARTSLAGVCDPYLGSQLGSGWVLSRAQELKRDTWRRMKDVGESSDQAVSALDLALGTLESHSEAKAPDVSRQYSPHHSGRAVV